MATAACAVAGVLAGGAEVAVVVAGAVVLPGAAEGHSRGCGSRGVIRSSPFERRAQLSERLEHKINSTGKRIAYLEKYAHRERVIHGLFHSVNIIYF